MQKELPRLVIYNERKREFVRFAKKNRGAYQGVPTGGLYVTYTPSMRYAKPWKYKSPVEALANRINTQEGGDACRVVTVDQAEVIEMKNSEYWREHI